MDHLPRMMDLGQDFEAVVSDGEAGSGLGGLSRAARSPMPKSRSLSDGGGTPRKLSPSPHIVEAARRQSKDDIAIRDKEHDVPSPGPSTPIRGGFPIRGLALQMPPRRDLAASPAQQSPYARPAPLSPKLDHSHMYASPTNILPRRSRGLDFSRAATSLHHSTLADPASPDSSPTIGSRAMSIPGHRGADHGAAEPTPTSLWSMMGNQERMQISSSVGSTSHVMSDLSSSSDDDDFMDEDMDEPYVTTPQMQRMGMPGNSAVTGTPWMPGPSAANRLLSFQQRQRQRKQSKKKARGPLGLGFQSPAAPGVMSRSPPNSLVGPKDLSLAHARRESISWAANQLHISGNESDDGTTKQLDAIDSPSRPSIVRRAVTRRGNLLPKPKGFARIRAALAEESAPIEAEFRREAEVVRQVRESDMDLEPRHPPPPSEAATTALSSPNLATHDSLDEMSEDIMMMDPSGSALGLAGTFKQQALKNSMKGRVFWDTFSNESSSSGAAAGPRVTPPPGPSFGLARASSSGLSLEDVSMDSPSAASSNGGGQSQHPFAVPHTATTTTSSSSGVGTPQPAAGQNGAVGGSNSNGSLGTGTAGGSTMPGGQSYGQGQVLPSAAEITRRINSKRRRDDDLDPVSIKRRAVSPGMSVHNSPVMQSPLQRDAAPWGVAGGGGSNGSSGNGAVSRPGSVGGDGITAAKTGGGGSGAPSENGSGSGVGVGGGGANSNGPRHLAGGGKGRVGFQGMVDTNDGITKLSIE